MKIVVAVRCLNEINHIPRFMKGYDFTDEIVVSDGGSTDGSIELLKTYPKVRLVHFSGGTTIDGEFWNEDAPHMNFVLEFAKTLSPDWLIFDDMDCNPNHYLRIGARSVLFSVSDEYAQVNAFRLYLWGEKEYFPHMNRNFDPDYPSLWAWRPNRINIYADPEIKHGTMVGVTNDPYKVELPMCLLHKSWHPDTIQQKVDRYNKIGLPMNHPLEHPDAFGLPEPLPEWAFE